MGERERGRERGRAEEIKKEKREEGQIGRENKKREKREKESPLKTLALIRFPPVW